MKTLLRLMAGGVAIAAATSGVAAPGERQPGPPPEAVAACSGKADGDKVTLTLPDGRTLAGTCHLQDGVLAARPAPPAEAVAACEGKVQGDPVSFAAPGGHTVSATCQLMDGVLAARPAGGPPPR